MKHSFRSLAWAAPSALVPAMVASLALFGCSHEYVRGSDDPSIDRAAMSTSLDKDDIERSLQTLLNQMRDASVMTEWRVKAGQGDRQTVAVSPFINETTEHIDPQLDTMLSDTEGWLVNAQIARVVSQERQAEMIRQVEGAQHPVFDPRHIPQYGKQLGVKFFITGKVGASDERADDARRVQYFIFMQVIDAETSEIRWQQKAYVTKALR
jgi:penicillin-binding protein activator